MQSDNRHVRMGDVASRAGVSVTTVSHVLNDVPGKRIRPETRARVHAAATDLGYVLNVVARSLRTNRSHVLALIEDEISTTPHAFGIIRGVQDAASKLGWMIIHTNTGVNRTSEDAQIKALQQRQVDGFLYVRMVHREVAIPAALAGWSTVLVDATCEDASVSSVVPDEYRGGRTATHELVRHGHTRIAFMNNIDDIPASRGRFAGYRSALEEGGVEFKNEYVVLEASDAGGGLRAGRALLALAERPTAIFCFTDRMAMGAYHAAHERGLSIPEDLSVIGFDNQTIVSEGLFPGLTSVALPHYEMGGWAVRTLIQRIERPSSVPVQVALNCPLVRRDSVGPPREVPR